MVNSSIIVTVLTCFISFGALLYNPLAIRFKAFGVGRWWGGFTNLHGEGLTFYEDTIGTEDIHYYEPGNVIFGIAEEKADSRDRWFPPMARFDASYEGQAHFFMITPEEKQISLLHIVNFTGPFIAHGFDIWWDPADEGSVYFFAVNHLPNPAYAILAKDDPKNTDIPKARSQIEIFHLQVGSLEIGHVRSIRHPDIRTPNDVFAISKREFYVTNDHFHREGGMRALEDIGHHDFGAWSDIKHVFISHLNSKTDPASGFTIHTAASDLQNPNGLGHGRTYEEVLMARAASGMLHTMEQVRPSKNKKSATTDEHDSWDPQTARHLNTTSTIQCPSTIDNPFYFHDPYAKEMGRDASGLVMAGLAFAAAWPQKINPSVVWLIQPPPSSSSSGSSSSSTTSLPISTWQSKLIFSDDGHKMNSASTGILVAIPPSGNGGKKQAYLFVAGPVCEGVIRTKIDL